MSEFADKVRSLGLVTGKARDKVVYAGDKRGERTKATTDELGNTVTEHQTGRVDVEIKAPKIQLLQREVRNV
jgi:hypothetical protein